MPELPEVETVRRGLEAFMRGKQVARVELRRPDLRIPFPPRFAETVAGRQVEQVTRRAKYLLMHLSGGVSVLGHLGMSGRFTVHTARPDTLQTHDHALFTFTDGSAAIYNDPRRFGLLTLCETSELPQHPLLAGLGPEPWDEAFTPAYLKAQLAARGAPVKVAIMDQALVVGVGNIYASEALFLAGIDPRLPARQAAPRAKKLHAAIHQVLEAAIASGGSSLKDFFNASGEAGYFQHSFSVYGRDEKPCITCGSEVSLLRQAARATFFCSRCQR